VAQHQAQINTLVMNHDKALQEQIDLISEAQAEKNSFRQKCAGLAKDLKRIMKQAQEAPPSDEKLVIENARLREELSRRTTSLQHAMEALQFHIIEEISPPENSKTTTHQSVRDVKQRPSISESHQAESSLDGSILSTATSTPKGPSPSNPSTPRISPPSSVTLSPPVSVNSLNQNDESSSKPKLSKKQLRKARLETDDDDLL